MTSVRQFFSYIAEGEHQRQDFKFKIDDAPKLARSVSAFANTDGGRLLIGVRDDGTVHGVRSDEEIFMMHAAAVKHCSPVPAIAFETLQVPTEPHGGRLRTVVICTVEPSPQRPVFAIDAATQRRTAFTRVADENIVASVVHLAIWRQDGHLRGEAYADTPSERLLLEALADPQAAYTLNSLCRRVPRLPRRHVVDILARFVRFGLADIILRDHQWVFCGSNAQN